MDTPTNQNPALVTDLEINLRICQHAFKFLPDTVGTLRPNAVFFLLVPPLSLSKLFIAVQSPNLVQQHWGDKEAQKCPNNFDWDSSLGAQEDWCCTHIAHQCCDQLTAVKTGYHLTVSRAQVSTHRSRVSLFVEVIRWQVTSFRMTNDCRLKFNFF